MRLVGQRWLLVIRAGRLVGCLGCRVLVAVVVFSVALAGVALAARDSDAAGLRRLGSLATGSVMVDSLASSPGVLATSTPQGINVFVEPVGGWRNGPRAATLLDPTPGTTSRPDIAVNGSIVVGEEQPTDGPEFEDVFVRPKGGWTGEVEPSARLIASDGTDLTSAVIAGRAILASAGDGIYAFDEPAGGWAGTVRESARLADPQGRPFQGLAMSGSSVFGSTLRRIDAFTKSGPQWVTGQRPAATLTAAGAPLAPIDAFGRTVLAGVSVFAEPRHGWHGKVTASAQIHTAGPSGTCCETALGAHVLAVSTYQLGAEHNCPCIGNLALSRRPSKGWKGAVVARQALKVPTQTGALVIAISGKYLFAAEPSTASGDITVTVYELP